MSQDHKYDLSKEEIEELLSITDIGIFIWNVETDHVAYSGEWARITGYELSELKPHVSTWEQMVLPEDLAHTEDAINRHISGEADFYEAEFRMTKKDGSIIWGHDKGKITKYGPNGEPLILSGVLQDITSIKLAEEKLRENTDVLELAINVTDLVTWDFDIHTQKVIYSDKVTELWGYELGEMDNTISEWGEKMHPEDAKYSVVLLNDFISGKRDDYNCEVRLKHKDGHYFWVKDMGKIVARDENGKPTRIFGAMMNIDKLISSQVELEKTLEELESHQHHLEDVISQRTADLLERDELLMVINDISRKLLTMNGEMYFTQVLTSCLRDLTVAYGADEIMLWRYEKINGVGYTYIAYRFSKGIEIAYDVEGMTNYIENLPPNEFFHKKDDGNMIICYEMFNQAHHDKMKLETASTEFKSNMPEDGYNSLVNNIATDKATLYAPVHVYNDLFGFIALAKGEKDYKFSEVQRNMLVFCGKIFANAQKKHEMDEQLRQAHEEALLSSQAKSNFLANMSHEIRTPLNAILGMAEIVLRESVGRSTEEYAKEIKTASESLLTIINDILDISKIESGKIEIINSDYEITSLLNDVISIAKVRLEDKAIAFTTFVDSSIPANLFGDEIRIKQVLLNLISNAIKFTPDGHIHFSVHCEKVDNIANLRFSIQDTGMGIKEEDLQRLFMQFERMDTKKNRNIEGTGLGLAITKQLCEMMGGTIEVQSSYGDGSKFTAIISQQFTDERPIFEFDEPKKILLYEPREMYAYSISETIANLNSTCEICMNQSELMPKLTSNEYDYLLSPTVHMFKLKNLKQKLDFKTKLIFMVEYGDMTIYREDATVNLPFNCIQLGTAFDAITDMRSAKSKTEYFIAPDANVLVVDDNQVNLKVAKGLMAPYKFNIETAVNGLEAVDMVQKNKYDLVFMDHMMPEMDGIDATSAIRALPDAYYKELPIIALTANALVGARELFINEGMNDFLAKPIEMSKLNEVLLRWIPKEKLVEISQKETFVKNDLNFYINGVNTSYGIKIIGGKLEDYLDVLNSFYNDGLEKTNTIYDNYVKKDINNYRIDVHSLKSAAKTIGAFNLSEKAKALELAAIKDDWQFIDANTNEILSVLNDVLNSIHEHISLIDDEDASDKEVGIIGYLKESLDIIEEALNNFDIDLIEQSLKNCNSYKWKGNINDLLGEIGNFVEAYEYYNARPLVDKIKEEIEKNY